MPAMDKIAYKLGRRDEVPNQQLARALAQAKDKRGIREIAGGLRDKNKSIRSDCLKVLYEIGYLNPGLIVDYVDDFLKLVGDRSRYRQRDRQSAEKYSLLQGFYPKLPVEFTGATG